MANVQLKKYQEETLASLRTFLERARFSSPQAAFESIDKHGISREGDRTPIAYKPLENAATPFVCLRLPTGGGKTLLAAHTIRLAAEAYLERDFPLVVWLVPTTTIKTQTLETLQTPGHANREALEAAFEGRVLVLDMADFTMLRPHDLSGKAVVLVGTVQSIKTEQANADSRKAYAHNENLEPFFARLPSGFEGYDVIRDGTDKGKPRYSFINLLRMHRPLVLVDEAHNNSTALALDVLGRIHAACVVEFTATPALNSNILHSVAATELKAEEMVKLPIVLTEHKTWGAAVHDSILTRQRLEGLAGDEDRYLRPIVLFQAQQKGEDIPWEVLKKHLIESENIPEHKIAVVTGTQRELDDVNLFDPACPIDFVITVQALKEGWDCSFAYVFCSLTRTHSSRDVEQLLGRVLRMPYARRRKHEELNKAYAHVSSETWPNAVMKLHDKLVKGMGFDEQEVEDSIETRQGGLGFSDSARGNFHPAPFSFDFDHPLTEGDLPDEVREHVILESGSDGGTRLTVRGVLDAAAQAKLVEQMPQARRAEARVTLQLQQAELRRALSPSAQGEPFEVPLLGVWVDGELEFPDEDIFLQAGDWRLDGPEKLENLTLQEEGMTFELDVSNGQLVQKFLSTSLQMNLNLVDTGMPMSELCRWLDRHLRQPDIAQPVMLEYVRRTLEWLQASKAMTLPALVRAKFILQKILERRIRLARAAAKKTGYDRLLFSRESKADIITDYVFRFEPAGYYPRQRYQGAFQPSKHYYPLIGDMNREEAECAKAIEMLGDDLVFWVRNLEREQTAFRLPTSTDNFYPDFVAKLADGRILVVEYKGEFLRGEDTDEKTNIGRVWAKASGNVYLTAWKSDKSGSNVFEQIRAAVATG